MCWAATTVGGVSAGAGAAADAEGFGVGTSTEAVCMGSVGKGAVFGLASGGESQAQRTKAEKTKAGEAMRIDIDIGGLEGLAHPQLKLRLFSNPPLDATQNPS